jgi:chromosome segregation ATPase
LNLPLHEARERLQNRIKQDNVELKQLEKEQMDMQKTVDTYKQNIKEIDSDMRDKGNQGDE